MSLTDLSSTSPAVQSLGDRMAASVQYTVGIHRQLCQNGPAAPGSPLAEQNAVLREQLKLGHEEIRRLAFELESLTGRRS